MKAVSAGLLAALIVLVGCGDEPAAGEKGGLCRVGDDPCNGDLVCAGGECSSGSDGFVDVVRTEDLNITLTLQDIDLQADGVESTILQFDVVDRATGEPIANTVVVRALPDEAATVIPRNVPLEKGHGVVQATACDASEGWCPSEFRLTLALLDNPTVVVAQSIIIRLRGTDQAANPPEPGSDGVVDAAVPPASTPPEPVEQTSRFTAAACEMSTRNEVGFFNGAAAKTEKVVRFDPRDMRIDGMGAVFGSADVDVQLSNPFAAPGATFTIPDTVRMSFLSKRFRLAAPCDRVEGAWAGDAALSNVELDAGGAPKKARMFFRVACASAAQGQVKATGCLQLAAP